MSDCVRQPGDLVQVIAAVGGGYCGLYEDAAGTWQGCLHDPHDTRQRALACAEARLAYEPPPT